MTRLKIAAAILCGLAAASPARAQSNFDQQQAAMLNRLMTQNQARMAAIQQSYMQQFGPMLRETYVSSGSNRQMSFEQYAYWMMMTANGTNVQGALDAQNEWFRNQQIIHRGQVETGERMIGNMRRNSDAGIAAVENWDNRVIRGDAPYVDPRSGQSVQLPYAAQPGAVSNWGGNTYMMGQDHNWWVQAGNRWVRMNGE